MMSERMYLWDGTNEIPVNPRTSTETLKQGVNEKVINYAIEFEYAHSVVNLVR